MGYYYGILKPCISFFCELICVRDRERLVMDVPHLIIPPLTLTTPIENILKSHVEKMIMGQDMVRQKNDEKEDGMLCVKV